MRNWIPFLKPNLVRKEAYLSYLSRIDDSHIYSNYGPLNTELEHRLLDYFFNGRGSVSTVTNATLGLMLAISLLRRTGGRYAVMPSFTFAATPQAALWCGLEPYFVDIDPNTWCLRSKDVAAALKDLGPEVAIVVPYAAFGTQTDLSYYTKLHEDGMPVVVDAAASLGTTNNDCHFGRDFPGAVVFSMHATKAFPVGEGGIVYSANSEFIAQLRQSANFGFSKDREATHLGLNAKMSEYHSAIGLATLDQFAEKKTKRQQVYSYYRENFNRHGLEQKGWELQQTEGSISFQFIPALCPSNTTNTAIVEHLERASIEARTYFRPSCHQQTLFRSSPQSSLDVTETIAARILSLPLWEDMQRKDVEQIVAALI